MRRMSCNAVVLLLLPVALGAGSPAWAATETAPPTAEQVQTWIKQLGSDQFQTRDDARAALVKAGKPATEALKAAQGTDDPEVKRLIGDILGQLQWVELSGTQNYLDLFPDDTIITFYLKGMEKSAPGAKQTAIAKLLETPDFKPLVDLLGKRLEEQMKQMEGMLPPGLGAPDPNQNPVLKLLKSFGGQIAAGVWKFNPMAMMQGNPEEAFGAAVIAELTCADPQGVFRQLIAVTGLAAQSEEVRQEGLTILAAPGGQGAITLAGKHLILAPNVSSVKFVANGLVKPPANRLSGSPSFLKMKPHLAGDPDLALYMNMQAYLKALGAMGVPGMGQMMNQMGYDALEYFALTTSVVGDKFEDRFVTVTNGKPSGMMKLAEMAYGQRTSLKEVFSIAPADAVVAGNSYLDGQIATDLLMEYLKSMGQLKAQMGLPAPDIQAEIAKVETQMGLKLTDLTGPIKGDITYWVTLSKELLPPDVGFSIGCADADKAKLLADSLSKLLDGAAALAKDELKIGGQLSPTTMKVEKDGRTLYTEAENSPLVNVPGRAMLPYRVTWAAAGTRVILTTTQVALQKRLLALDNKSPGFDHTKVLDAGQPEPVQLMAVDLRALFNYGAKFGFPLLALQAGNADPEIMGVLNTMAAKEDLFQGMPFLTASNLAPKDGVYSAVLRGPMPVVPTAFVAGVAAVLVPTAIMKANAAGGRGAKGF